MTVEGGSSVGGVQWVDALGSLDWTLIIISLIGGSGLLGIHLQTRAVRRQRQYTREEEQQVLNPTKYDPEALRLANQAMEQVTKLSGRLETVEEELGHLSRAHDVLEQWAERVVRKWSTIRHQEEPPAIPREARRRR